VLLSREVRQLTVASMELLQLWARRG
jgi:hypothetical protein